MIILGSLWACPRYTWEYLYFCSRFYQLRRGIGPRISLWCTWYLSRWRDSQAQCESVQSYLSKPSATCSKDACNQSPTLSNSTSPLFSSTSSPRTSSTRRRPAYPCISATHRRWHPLKNSTGAWYTSLSSSCRRSWHCRRHSAWLWLCIRPRWPLSANWYSCCLWRGMIGKRRSKIMRWALGRRGLRGCLRFRLGWSIWKDGVVEVMVRRVVKVLVWSILWRRVKSSWNCSLISRLGRTQFKWKFSRIRSWETIRFKVSSGWFSWVARDSIVH